MHEHMKKSCTYFDIETTKNLFAKTERGRLSTRVEIHQIAFISVSTMTNTKRGVKKKKYHCITGQFHHTFTRPQKKKRKKKKAEEDTKNVGQQQLDFKVMTSPYEFTRAGTLHAVANLIATNNQVSC